MELDYVEAYKWRRLAAAYSPADKRNTYADSAEAVTRFMTPQQVAESDQRVRDWTVAFEKRSRSESRVAPAASAQSSPSPTRPQQAFKSSIDLVEVETTVVNADAMQVRDLSLDDFSVEVDGHPRPIVSVRVRFTAGWRNGGQRASRRCQEFPKRPAHRHCHRRTQYQRWRRPGRHSGGAAVSGIAEPAGPHRALGVSGRIDARLHDGS